MDMDERELIKKYKETRDKEALGKLIEMHKGFIHKIARKYYSIFLKIGNSNYLEFNDFYNTTIEGFIKAISNFDLSYQNKLLTYAKNWMEVYAKLFLDKNLSSLGEPEGGTISNNIVETPFCDSGENNHIDKIDSKIDFVSTVKIILKHLDINEQFIFLSCMGLLEHVKKNKDIANITFKRHQRMARMRRRIMNKIKNIEGLDQDALNLITEKMSAKRINPR